MIEKSFAKRLRCPQKLSSHPPRETMGVLSSWFQNDSSRPWQDIPGSERDSQETYFAYIHFKETELELQSQVFWCKCSKKKERREISFLTGRMKPLIFNICPYNRAYFTQEFATLISNLQVFTHITYGVLFLFLSGPTSIRTKSARVLLVFFF